ncbi:hypothetical protein RHS01_03186 [Rhizoctonia solani]|uniref:Uncharacterized protein n=1 Tax=Rhizoctonia solani TaxID=456999 RepID=A0A8H7IKK9_9AGAM|nr:hypothetical protein RHS01_03186 [Rhizoctonia solani]
MPRLKTRMIWSVLIVATWVEVALAYSINATIYDTNTAHVTYSDTPIACKRWVNSWLFWKVCDSWVEPWAPSTYHLQGKVSTLHSSLNHQTALLSVDFKGTDVWVYGPPLSQLTKLQPDYKICLYENYPFSPKPECYQVNIIRAYYASKDENKPVVVFARGRLQHRQHRIEISVADPTNDLQAYDGIKFSHVVYTTKRPTHWPVEEDRWRYAEVVMHDTHPLLSYFPPTTSDPLAKTPAWLAKVHTADDGTVTSWHELRSHNEGGQDHLRVVTKIKAGAVAVYGAPSAYVEQNRYDLGFICVQLDLGLCEVVDLKTIYANHQQKYRVKREPVLLWRSDVLDSSRETLISIRQVKASTGTGTVFPFKSINYFEAQEYAHPVPRVAIGKLENITITNDDRSISYNPTQLCDKRVSRCDPWTHSWIRREVGPLGSKSSFQSTIWNHRAEMDPHIILSFKGSALYLYGAPNAYAARPLASQHVCINNMCRVIDVEQAYLHSLRDTESTSITTAQKPNSVQGDTASLSIPHPELEPVLIWSITGLDDKILHTFRLALASIPVPLNAEMTFAKILYTEVSYRYGKERPDPPAPKPDHAYTGPPQPPYAIKWNPLDHKAPPPFSINPSPPQGSLSPLLLTIIVLVVLYVCLSLGLGLWRHKGDETQPLLSSSPPHRDPTPSYSYETPRVRLPRSPSTDALNAADDLPAYSSTTSTTSGQRR